MPDVQQQALKTDVLDEQEVLTVEADQKPVPKQDGKKAKDQSRTKKSKKKKFKKKKKGPSLWVRALRGLVNLFSRFFQAIRRNARPSNVILAAGFILLLGLLFARSATYTLNQQVYELEQELSQVQGEIDSKEGQLISSADIKEVEEQARALGMTEAQPGQYIYESYSQKNISNGELPGFADYLSMFREIREGMLWP